LSQVNHSSKPSKELEKAEYISRYGKILVQLYAAFRNAETEVKERILRVEASWLRTSDQLEFLKRIAELLDEQHKLVQQETLRVLASKLETAITKLESILKTTKKNDLAQDEGHQINRVKYLFLKESIDNAIEDLKVWQDVFDPSWFLIMKAATPQVDTELRRTVEISANRQALHSAQSLRMAVSGNEPASSTIFFPENGLGSIQLLDIPFSSVKLGERPGPGSNLILDRIPCSPLINPSILRKSIATLALKLSHSDPTTFGLLTCKGVVVHNHNRREQLPEFTLILRIPLGYSEPQTLRSYLVQQHTNHSLSDRFKLAKDLVKAVGYVHTFGFVHKSIRPETILVFKSSTSTIGSVSLVGFENFRTEDGRTLHSGDTTWEKNLYRHPRRQGENPEDDYVMQHDIYSLGVCLLELGLWESFVNYNEDATIAQPSQALSLPTEFSMAATMLLMKDHFVSLTRTLLPIRMGNNYAEIVETCLTCLDEKNSDFGDENEFLDQDGIRVGVRYIEKVTSLQVNM